MANYVPHRTISNKIIGTKDIVDKCPYQEVRVTLDRSSSEEDPIRINAYDDERTVAYISKGKAEFVHLKKGPPVKGPGGCWFQLVDAKKFWLD